MADILDFKDIYPGGEIAILGNGPSLFEHLDLLDNIPTIGINASLEHYPSKYHVAIDQEALIQVPELKYQAEYLFTTNLPYKLPNVKTQVVDIPSRHQDVAWSSDLTDCIYTGKASIWFAAQVAAWMVGSEGSVYFIGFDLNGERPKGHLHEGMPMPSIAISRQLELAGYLRGLIDTEAIDQKFYVCSDFSSITLLPKVKFRNRHFIKNTAYEPAMDVDITFTRRAKRIGGGVKVSLDDTNVPS